MATNETDLSLNRDRPSLVLEPFQTIQYLLIALIFLFYLVMIALKLCKTRTPVASSLSK